MWALEATVTGEAKLKRMSPVAAAIARNGWDTVRFLVGAGFCTLRALDVACKFGATIGNIESLLSLGHDGIVTAAAIHYAAFSNRVPLVRLLHSRGLAVTSERPMLDGCSKNQAKMVVCLIEIGAPVPAGAGDYVAKTGNLALVKLLHEKASLNVFTSHAMDEAAGCSLDIVRGHSNLATVSRKAVSACWYRINRKPNAASFLRHPNYISRVSSVTFLAPSDPSDSNLIIRRSAPASLDHGHDGSGDGPHGGVGLEQQLSVTILGSTSSRIGREGHFITEKRWRLSWEKQKRAPRPLATANKFDEVSVAHAGIQSCSSFSLLTWPQLAKAGHAGRLSDLAQLVDSNLETAPATEHPCDCNVDEPMQRWIFISPGLSENDALSPTRTPGGAAPACSGADIHARSGLRLPLRCVTLRK
ncbi:hypothetical protein BDK51DRAFT_52278 [Blyttiomyces helicus]|uniref:Ankyrin repeat-containing domain protein n=1 Tax=Blyttiomyces helicus TaxID=388810 RepID=A0A4P9VXG1_9FUNG|nr:hypothetical protein BDK51DRAFT_52278 [Blyttiomyces helicus]|eukprot:RKO83932.1 hypothetical protein BDK51DRAFT_52278 [Blyttiomyces helicus]